MTGNHTGMAFRRTWKQSQKQATASMKRYYDSENPNEQKVLLAQASGYIADAISTDRTKLPQQWIDNPHPRRTKHK